MASPFTVSGVCRLLIFNFQTACNSTDVPPITEVIQVCVLLILGQRHHVDSFVLLPIISSSVFPGKHSLGTCKQKYSLPELPVGQLAERQPRNAVVTAHACTLLVERASQDCIAGAASCRELACSSTTPTLTSFCWRCRALYPTTFKPTIWDLTRP